MRLSWIYGLTMVSVALADTNNYIYCNLTSQCPQDKPCCSQYGVCGTGAYCLGGCDIRFSYNISACMPAPVMDSFSTTFDSTDLVMSMNDYLGNASETDWVYSGNIDTNDGAILLQMPKNSVGTVISSTKYLYYGRIGIELKSSRDAGVVTAFIVFSDVQDEVDFEFVGYNLTAPQTNYYYQGQLDYNNSRNYTVSNTFENYHLYEIDWHEDHIDWYIDGDLKRTLNKNDTYNATSKIYKYPQTPSRIQISLWPGGLSTNGLGTIEWAGGLINWDSQDIQENGYYYAYLKSATVQSYGIPDTVQNKDKASTYHAYIYNSVEGHPENVLLTDAKTYLGSLSDSGLNPNNESSSSSSSSASSTKSGSKSSTASSSSSTSTKGSDNVPQGVGNGVNNDQPGNSSNTGTTTSRASQGTGGFVQNSGSTSSSSSARNEGSRIQSVGALITALFLGIASLGF